MDSTILNQIRAEPEIYIQKAEMFLRDTEEQFLQVAARYSTASIQYCDKENKLEQARAIHRGVTAINAGRVVMFSDKVTLCSWLSRSE
ncbi:MAG: hypothetical protein H6R07_369 [Proteobacteria bacterium]|nr:hypothetical protein [Pseudomonadota bacterium]